MQIPLSHIDPDALKVIRRLRRYGQSAYLVGGCVRDLLLGRTPKDFDIATSATPDEIRDLFRNCRIIGRRFRLAHIFFGAKIIETSTFRTHPREGIEGEEEPSGELLIRRDNVFGTAEEDARRRDFTINGLFYDAEAEKVIDYVEGLTDLEQRLVRTIGDPDIRFREDPIRILRAVKFAARLDFSIEPATYQAMLAHKGEIPKCAPPRILEELYRLLRGGAAKRSVELLEQTGILAVLVPALERLIQTGGLPTLEGEEPEVGGSEKFWRYVAALDQRTAEPVPPSNAVLLGTLLLPFLPELFAAEGSVHPGDRLEQIAKPVLAQMGVSRRDNERTRQILVAQRRLVPAQKRRRRPYALLSRDYFVEALELYEIAVRAEDASTDEASKWRDLLAGRAEAASPPGEERVGRKRRRRRRGRRRGSVTPTTGQPVQGSA